MSKMLDVDVTGDVLVVNVTQADIDNGVASDHARCAIAQALMRQGFGLPSVCGASISTGRGISKVEWEAPEAACLFQDQFDLASGSVRPSVFVLTRVNA